MMPLKITWLSVNSCLYEGLVSGVHKQDVDEVIKTSVEKLNQKYGGRYRYIKLVNGYRRFEPVRGMEYKVDLQLFDKVGEVKLIPLPYFVTRNFEHLIVACELR